MTECNKYGEQDPWPSNWKEILNRCPRCDRCGINVMPRLYCLPEFPNIQICHLCCDDYHEYIKKFVDDINEAKKQRQNLNE